MARAAAVLALPLLTAAVIPPAWPQGHLGLSIGYARGDCAVTQASDPESSCRNDDTKGYELFGGYSFSRRFGIEASFVEHDGILDRLWGVGSYSAGQSITVAGRAALPIKERWVLFARAGIARWEIETGAFGNPGTAPGEGTDPTLGVGIEFHLPTFAVRAKRESTDFGGIDVEVASLGFVVKF